MKRIVIFVISLILLLSNASALTVSEFVERYNKELGEGYYTVYSRMDYVQDGFLFATGTDDRHMVILQIDFDTADSLDNAKVEKVFIRMKARVKPSTFMNNISSAMAAVFPDVPEEIRLAEIIRCMRVGDRDLGLYVTDTQAVPYHSEYFGEMVYQEETNQFTFLFSVPKEQP